jgi:hypothetical protein
MLDPCKTMSVPYPRPYPFAKHLANKLLKTELIAIFLLLMIIERCSDIAAISDQIDHPRVFDRGQVMAIYNSLRRNVGNPVNSLAQLRHCAAKGDKIPLSFRINAICRHVPCPCIAGTRIGAEKYIIRVDLIGQVIHDPDLRSAESSNNGTESLKDQRPTNVNQVHW